MAWERSADDRDPPASNAGLDAELERAVTSGEALAYVVLFTGDNPGRIYAIKRNTVLIGRADEADVHIVDGSVSSNHARIVNRSGGFEIVDLDSTNGTFVGGKRVARSALRNGDHVTVGSVEFLFMLDHPTNATIKLPDSFKRAPTTNSTTALVPTRQPVMAPRISVSLPASHGVPLPRSERGERGEDEPSLADMVHKVAKAFRFMRENRLVIAAFAAVGVALGIFSIIISPPGVAASGEVKLLPHLTLTASQNEDRWQNSDQDSGQFAKAAERTLTQQELVRSTLAKLGSNDPADAWVRSIISRIKVEETGDHVFRASYKDKASARPTPLDFLTVHLQNYIQSEIGKSVRELSAKVDFLRDQLKSVEGDLDRISDQRAGFREANADRLPEDSEQTHTSRFELETRKAQLSAQIHGLQGELNAALGQLKNNRPEAQRKFQWSETYRTQLNDIDRKLTEAYARGLKEGHPEVQQLQEEKKRIQALANSELQTATPTIVRESDPNYQQAQNEVEKLEAELAAARASMGETEGALGQVRRVVQDLPRVEQHLSDLEHRQEATKQLHSDLFSKLKQAEIQLNLEKVSAESRYDCTPPQALRPRKTTTLALRGSLGLLFGLLVAGLVLLLREAQKMISHTLVSSPVVSRVVAPRDRRRDRF
jgi:pSer/pThr/pTyr-binding forkhead associated (FHA) protein